MRILKNPFVISLVLAVLIVWGLIYGTLVWLESYTRHNEAVVVPDVKGLTIEKAEPFLQVKRSGITLSIQSFPKRWLPVPLWNWFRLPAQR